MVSTKQLYDFLCWKLSCYLREIAEHSHFVLVFWPLMEERQNGSYFYSVSPTWKAPNYPLGNNTVFPPSFIQSFIQPFWVPTRYQVLCWWQVQRRKWKSSHTHGSPQQNLQIISTPFTSRPQEALCFFQSFSSAPFPLHDDQPNIKDIFFSFGLARAGWIFLCLV